MSPLTASQRAYANELISFIQSSPTPFHAVSTAKQILAKAGFIELVEREPWVDKVQRGKKYFVTRNGTSLIAFGVGGEWEAGKGSAIVAAHTGPQHLFSSRGWTFMFRFAGFEVEACE